MRYSTSLLLAAALSAQVAPFSQPVTTDDGQTVYFLSPLVLTTAPAPVAPTGGTNSSVTNLYRLGKSGIQLLSASATGPQVSGDGSTVGYTDPNVCVTTGTSTSCGRKAMLFGPPAVDLGAGTLQMSRNGRWAVVGSLPSPLAPSETALIDTTNGTRVVLPGTTPIGALSVVASDGSVLLQQTATNQIGLWRNGQFTPLNVRPTALSDDGSTLIYLALDTAAGVSTYRIVARKVTDSTEVVVADKVPTPMVPMGLSSDGQSILYRVVTNATNGSGAAYFATASTGKAIAIALPEGESVFEGTLSGSGTNLILTTTLGRILRATVAGGVAGPVQEVVPASPYLNLQSSAAVGSYTALLGTVSGTIESLTGKLVFGGVPVVVLAAKPGEVDVQIPWEVPFGYARFQVLAGNSPFKQDQMIFASGFGPRYFSLPAGQTTILGAFPLIRGDFSGFQTTQPQAGDIVVLYMAGLGPVQGSPVTGRLAPVTPLHLLVATLTCKFTPQTTNAKTLYAGLAPGMVGIYQVVFQMPVDASTAPLNGMQCAYSAPGSAGSFSFIGTPLGGN